MMSTPCSRATLLAMMLALLVPALASADIPPPNTESCGSQEAGASCKTDDGKAGACVKSTCSRNDYSNGVPPTTENYECLICEAGAKPTGSVSSSTSRCTLTGFGPARGGFGAALLFALVLLGLRARQQPQR